MSSKKLKAEQQQQLFDALTALQKKFALARPGDEIHRCRAN